VEVLHLGQQETQMLRVQALASPTEGRGHVGNGQRRTLHDAYDVTDDRVPH
jgi:hypothetical protein